MGEAPEIDPRAARFNLECRASAIDGWGVFAAERIPARRRVIEYTGRRIRSAEEWRQAIREKVYTFWTGKRTAIDGAAGGSGAEFINHSCEPNLAARVRSGRVFLSSLRPIEAGEELLLDYKISANAPCQECRCGSPRCRGTMNRPEDQTR